MKTRGIVVRPSQPIPYRFSIDPDYLRYCLVYWDQIDCPDASPLSAPFVDDSPDLASLQELGILKRTRGFFFSKEDDGPVLMRTYEEFPEQFWTIAQLYTLQKNNQRDELWSIGSSGSLYSDLSAGQPNNLFFVQRPPFDENQGGNIMSIGNMSEQPEVARLIRSPSIDLELYNSLPVPALETTIESILRFREERQDELNRLRHALDGLYLDIVNSQDIPRSRSFVLDEIDQSLRDLAISMKDRGWKRVWSTVKTKIDIGNLISKAVLAMIEPSTVALSAVEGIVGAVTSVFKANVDLSALKPAKLPDGLRDYQYIYHVKKELGD